MRTSFLTTVACVLAALCVAMSGILYLPGIAIVLTILAAFALLRIVRALEERGYERAARFIEIAGVLLIIAFSVVLAYDTVFFARRVAQAWGPVASIPVLVMGFVTAGVLFFTLIPAVRQLIVELFRMMRWPDD